MLRHIRPFAVLAIFSIGVISTDEASAQRAFGGFGGGGGYHSFGGGGGGGFRNNGGARGFGGSRGGDFAGRGMPRQMGGSRFGGYGSDRGRFADHGSYGHHGGAFGSDRRGRYGHEPGGQRGRHPTIVVERPPPHPYRPPRRVVHVPHPFPPVVIPGPVGGGGGAEPPNPPPPSSGPTNPNQGPLPVAGGGGSSGGGGAAPAPITPERARAFRLPPVEEHRYVPNEVVVTIGGNVPADRLQLIEQTYGLTPLAATHLDLLGVDVRRYRVGDNTSVRGMILALRDVADVRSAQPNYLFQIQGGPSEALATPTSPGPEAPTAPAPAQLAPPSSAEPAPNAPPAPEPQADSADQGRPLQYAIDTMGVDGAHKLATGMGVLIAVIDTGLDETHPELAGRIAENFDTVGGAFRPHAHGTAMAGVIVAHRDLIGIAPDAQLLAIRAFDTIGTGSGEGTSYDIVRGIDYAVLRHATILNMSFAGPRDDLLSDALAKARLLGVVEIAAAGNGGPDAEPLYPGAEPGVIAVTATDTHNRLFTMANRGAYVALAAPGVDVIAPSTDGAMQLTSGTSVAAAEASGVVALLLQAHPGMGSEDIKHLLAQTALPLADQTGRAGELIDAHAALEALAVSAKASR